MRYLIVAALAACLNPVASVVLINWAVDRYENGAIGAAIATVATEVLVTSGALLLRSRGVMDRATVGFVARTVSAGGVMALAVWALDWLPLPVRVVIGMAVYVVAATAMGTINVGDLRRVANAFTSAAGSARRRRPTSGQAEAYTTMGEHLTKSS
jgi:hypothetical protein